MDVLYLGLARGFAVAVDDSIAAAGSPETTGWRWTWDPELAAAVRRAIRYHRRELPAELVQLPLVITGREQKEE
jgi:hypothetical protein